MAQWVKNVISTQKDVGLTPGLYQWVKDPAWPQTVAEVADVAGIQRFCGCGVGWQQQVCAMALIEYEDCSGNKPGQ